MQLTRFDRWLREKYVYQTQIHTLRPPESLPNGVRAVKMPYTPGKRYKYLYIANKTKAAEQLIRHLKEAGQMYTTQIVDRDRWYIPFIAPKNKSVTWRTVSVIFTFFVLCGVFMIFVALEKDLDFQRNFADALKLFKS